MNTKVAVLKMKKVLKKLVSSYRKEERNQPCQLEIEDNAVNEAIEAKLAELLASAPPSQQTLLRWEFSGLGAGSVYSGCQVAGPQLAR